MAANYDIRSYITAKLDRFGFVPTDYELEALLALSGISEPDQYDLTPAEVDSKAKTLLAKVIPELLLQPDVTEGGYSIKRDKAAITAYYNLLCADLGVPNTLTSKATLTDKSYLW